VGQRNQGSGTVNLNEANRDELMRGIPGAGLDVAEAIVRFREERGRIENIDELDQASGISDSMLETIKLHATV
jgi:competence ComEA-like helix-hairpin-helix protein